MNDYSWSFSQDINANETDNSKEFFVAVKYEADLEVRGYVCDWILSLKLKWLKNVSNGQ